MSIGNAGPSPAIVYSSLAGLKKHNAETLDFLTDEEKDGSFRTVRVRRKEDGQELLVLWRPDSNFYVDLKLPASPQDIRTAKNCLLMQMGRSSE